MKPDSKQPARLYGRAKTNIFENLEGITLANLKFWPIIDQTGTFTYNARKVISYYLIPLGKNEYSIIDTQKLLSMISSISTLKDDEEDVSYDFEPLSRNIPIEETINYNVEQNYVHKTLTPICLKLIFRRLLIKIVTEYTFKFNSRVYTIVPWQDPYLLLLVTFIWLKRKILL